MMSLAPDVFLLSPDGLLNRMKIFAGGFYIFLLCLYIVLVNFDSIRSREFVLLKSRGVAFYALIAGTIIISAWLGYSDGGLLVAGAVGIVPSVAFTTIGVVLTALNLNEPDAPIWVFSASLLGFGLLLAAIGFLFGKGIQIALGAV